MQAPTESGAAILPLVALAFLGGVAAAAHSTVVAIVLIAAGLAGIILTLWRGQHRRLVLAGLCLLAVGGGAARWLHHDRPLTPSDLGFHLSRAAAVRGVIENPPLRRQRSLEVTVAVNSVQDSAGWRPVQGRLLLWTRPYSELRVGDELVLAGSLQAPAERLPAGYAAYLRRRGVQAVMWFPQVRVGRQRQSSPIIHRLRSHLRRVIDQRLPEPHAALAAGILLGQRANIPGELMEQMHATGTSHIVAISGANLTLIAALLSLALRRIGSAATLALIRFPSLDRWVVSISPSARAAALAIPALAAIWAYAWLVGWGASVVRAAVMSSLVLLAPVVGRRAFAPTSLTWAALLMVAIHPSVLWDAGFQLSVVATAGILFLAPPLQVRLSWLPAWVREPLALTLAAQVAVLPVLLVAFGRVSLIAPLPNVLLASVLPPIMVSGLTLLLLGGLAPVLAPSLLTAAADLLAWILWAYLDVLIRTAQLFAAIPWAAWTPPSSLPPLVVLGASASAVGLLWWFLRRSGRGPDLPAGVTGSLTALALVTLPAAMVSLWALMAAQPPQQTQLWLPPAEGGQVAVARLPSGRTILIDGGSTTSGALQLLGRALPFWQRRIDLVVLADPRAATLTRLVPVLERYEVGLVLDASYRYPSAMHRRYEDLIRQHRVTRRQVRVGDRVALDGGTLLDIVTTQPLPQSAQQRRRSQPASRLGLVLHTPQGIVWLPGTTLAQDGDRLPVNPIPGRQTDTIPVLVRPLGTVPPPLLDASAALTIIQGRKLAAVTPGEPPRSVTGGVRVVLGDRGPVVWPLG